MNASILKSALTVTLFLCACFMQYGQSKDQWTAFRGNNSSGIAHKDAKPPTEFRETQNLLWKVPFPDGTSSPVVWDNHIYLTGYLKDDSALLVLCVNMESGEHLWTDTVVPPKIQKHHAISSPAQSTLAVDEDGVYVYFSSEGARCYGHQGNLKWKKKLARRLTKKWGIPISPIIVDDKIIINRDFGRPNERKPTALKKFSGEIIWKPLSTQECPVKKVSSTGFSTPIRYKNQIIIHRDGGIVSYSRDDGSPIWWMPMITNGISTPIIHKDKLYVTAFAELTKSRRGAYFDYKSFDKFLGEFDKNRDKLIVKEEIPDDIMLFNRPEIKEMDDSQWPLSKAFNMMDKSKNDIINKEEWDIMFAFAESYCDDVGLMVMNLEGTGERSRDEIIWQQLDKIPEVPCPVANGDYVYMVKNGGWLTCMDAETGEVQYCERIGGKGACIASPIIGNGHIYIASYNGLVTVIKEGKEPKVVSQTKLEGKIGATPAIVKNQLIVRTNKYLYAFKD